MIIFKARQASDPQYLLEVIHENFGNATLINFSLEIPFFSVERAVFDVDPEIFIKCCTGFTYREIYFSEPTFRLCFIYLSAFSLERASRIF